MARITKTAKNDSWDKIFSDYKILEEGGFPFVLTAEKIKAACHDFRITSQKEVRILCKQDSREDVPDIMARNNLFLLSIKNGTYAIVKGKGYVDIPRVTSPSRPYTPKLPFDLETSKVGNSEMQHLDYAYATSMIRSFFNDDSLVLTIRGRKYSPKLGFSFFVGRQKIEVKSVQVEVDAGYEGKSQIVLIEAKNSKTDNTNIRQLFYPFRQWSSLTSKRVRLLFFEKRGEEYTLWEYRFNDKSKYNSIELVKSARYHIAEK